mgnify:CR=1 FL=1
MDLFGLLHHIPAMQAMSLTAYLGGTGRLSLDQHQVIKRAMHFALLRG